VSKTSVAAPWILDEVDWNGMKALTSRKEYDIESTLQPIIIATVSMEDTRVDPDIRIHVEQCMCEDPKLSKWDTKIKEEIVNELVSRAKGMYYILRFNLFD